MKTWTTLCILALFSVPSFAGGHTTSRTPMMEDEVERMEDHWVEEEMMEEQRMEERDREDNSPRIDYSDRTRTDRARKALNTGSQASDDQ